MAIKKKTPGISVKIELATDNERDWAAAVMATADPWLTLGVTEEQCRSVCHDLQYIVYIAHYCDQPSGLIILHRHGLAGSPYIKSVAVAANTRSRGVGKALIGFAEDLFRPEAKHIFLCVSSFNRGAQRLYKQLGYRKVGEFEDYVVAGESEWLMHKLLK
jgi:ribosomal-protein-alanine N-acetyltransferase